MSFPRLNEFSTLDNFPILQDDSDTVPRSCIENFPDEVLIEFFTYLAANDLKRVLMTSHAFNEIVGQSTRMMKKFVVKISPKRKWDFESLGRLRRKHQNVKLVDFKSDDDSIYEVIRELHNFGRNVKYFELNDCGVSTEKLVKILNTMEKLESVVLMTVKTADEAKNMCDRSSLPELKCLSHLKVVESDMLFEIFLKARTLEEICFQAHDCQNVNLKSLEELLSSQQKLKTFEIINVRFSNFLENKIKFPFQLRSLTIHQCHFKEKENFESFLESQNELTEIDLTINNMKLQLDRVRYFEDSLATVLKHKSLKQVNLEIENYNFANTNFLRQSTNENVESLKLTLAQTTCPAVDVLKIFPNIETLELSLKNIDDDSLKFINEHLHKLQALTITKFSSEAFAKLKIKNLKSLHINETNIQPEHWLEFLENQPKITKLVINFTFFMDLTEDFIDTITRKLNLEHIELIDKWIGMKNEIYETICANCKNLKYLKLWNINVEKDFDETDKEFLRSRNIEFHLFNDESLNTPMVPF